MSAKRKKSVRFSPSSDEVPSLTERWIAEADLSLGNKLVRRGRPKLDSPRKLLSPRLPSDVIANWKATGCALKAAKSLERTRDE